MLPLGTMYQDLHHLTAVYLISFMFCMKPVLYIVGPGQEQKWRPLYCMNEDKNF